MDSVATAAVSPQARAASLRRWLVWAGAAALSAPAAIILHELGHFAVAYVFGFPDVALHFGSVSESAAEGGFPRWQQGLQAAAGPLVTLAIVLLCCYAARRVGPHPWAVAPAFAAGVRSVAIGTAYLAVRLRHPSAGGNFDEGNAAVHLGLSTDVVVVANVLLLLIAWAYLVHQIRRGRRIAALSAIGAGTVAGLALYIGWWGPQVLP